MKNRPYRSCAALLVLFAFCACNGQFDFDLGGLDAGPETPVIVIEGGPEDLTPAGDTPIEGTRPDIHIACGNGTSCQVSGCCSTSTEQTCVDIAAGETCGGLLIQCDDSEDCPEGQVCCAEGADDHDPNDCGDGSCPSHDRPDRVHCEPEAHCRMANYIILCNPDRPDTCTQCVASTIPGLPPGYHQCETTP